MPFICESVRGFGGHVVCCRADENYPFSYDCYLSSVSGYLQFHGLRLIGGRLRFFVSRRIPRIGFISEAFGYGRSRTVTV